jgi:hypothetical protein
MAQVSSCQPATMVPPLGMVGRAPGGGGLGRLPDAARVKLEPARTIAILFAHYYEIAKKTPPIPAREVCGQGRSPARMVPLRAVY